MGDGHTELNGKPPAVEACRPPSAAVFLNRGQAHAQQDPPSYNIGFIQRLKGSGGGVLKTNMD